MRFFAGRLLIFAKAPVAGAAKTRLAPVLGTQGAADLHARLTRHTVETAVSAALAPVEVWCYPDCRGMFPAQRGVTPQTQRGEDLGARMFHALDAVLARHAYAVLIGTDCPVMSADYLRGAFQRLEAGADAVLGPVEDGGYVLIGLRRVERSLFDGVPWGTAEVLAQTRQRLAALGWRWQELDTLWDVDRPQDLVRLQSVMPL